MFTSGINAKAAKILTSASKTQTESYLVLPRNAPTIRISSNQSLCPKDNKRNYGPRRRKSSSKRVRTNRTIKTTARASGHNVIKASQLKTATLSLIKAIGAATSKTTGGAETTIKARIRGIDHNVINRRRLLTGIPSQSKATGTPNRKATGPTETRTITTIIRIQNGDMRPKEKSAATTSRATEATTMAITMAIALVAAITMALSITPKDSRLRLGYRLSQSQIIKASMRSQFIQTNPRLRGEITEDIMGNTEMVAMDMAMVMAMAITTRGLNTGVQEIHRTTTGKIIKRMKPGDKTTINRATIRDLIEQQHGANRTRAMTGTKMTMRQSRAEWHGATTKGPQEIGEADTITITAMDGAMMAMIK
jgi:hypothetical protein